MTTKRVSIPEAEKIAQDRMFEARNGEWDKHFMLTVPGKVPTLCSWLDPYMGTFQIVGRESEGFMLTGSLPSDSTALLP